MSYSTACPVQLMDGRPSLGLKKFEARSKWASSGSSSSAEWPSAALSSTVEAFLGRTLRLLLSVLHSQKLPPMPSRSRETLGRMRDSRTSTTGEFKCCRILGVLGSSQQFHKRLEAPMRTATDHSQQSANGDPG